MKKNNSNYDPKHFSILGQNYIKVCFLILDAIDDDKLKDFEQRQILFPLIYNFRHAAELFLKSVLLESKIEFELTHDLSGILSSTATKLSDYFSNSYVPIGCNKSFLKFKEQIEIINCGKFGGVKIIDKKDKNNEFFRFIEKELSDEYIRLRLIDFSILRKQIRDIRDSYFRLQSAMSVMIRYEIGVEY
jgi:hypothetical protein